jgi:hypothetical protein
MVLGWGRWFLSSLSLSLSCATERVGPGSLSGSNATAGCFEEETVRSHRGQEAVGFPSELAAPLRAHVVRLLCVRLGKKKDFLSRQRGRTRTRKRKHRRGV